MQEIAPGVVYWSAQHEGIGKEVSSYYLADGHIALNPMLPPGGVDALGPVEAVLLTNRHHLRHSGAFSEHYGCTVRAPREGMHEFTQGESVEPYGDGDELPGGVRAHAIGALSPDEYALEVPSARAVALADGVVRWRTGEPLAFVPDQLMGDDPETVKDGLLDGFERLLDEVGEIDHLLLAHGEPVVGDGGAALRAFLDDQRRARTR